MYANQIRLLQRVKIEQPGFFVVHITVAFQTLNVCVYYSYIFRDDLNLLEEGQGVPREELDERIAREEFRRPRESLLNICTEFYKHSGPRLKILQNVAGEPRVTALELLDIKSHMRFKVVYILPTGSNIA